MAGVTLDVKIEDQGVLDLIARLRERTSNLSPAMKIIGSIVRTSVIRNFEAGGRPEKWKPLKGVSYELGYTMGKKRKAFKKRGGLTAGFQRYIRGKKILIGQGMAGGLMASIHPRAYKDRVVIGTNKVYGAIHQLGGKAGRGHKVNIPARPYLKVQEEDWVEIRAAISDYLMARK